MGYHVSSITNYRPRPRAAGRLDNMGQETLAQCKGIVHELVRLMNVYILRGLNIVYVITVLLLVIKSLAVSKLPTAIFNIIP